jgi:hypothetical protein
MLSKAGKAEETKGTLRHWIELWMRRYLKNQLKDKFKVRGRSKTLKVIFNLMHKEGHHRK